MQAEVGAGGEGSVGSGRRRVTFMVAFWRGPMSTTVRPDGCGRTNPSFFSYCANRHLSGVAAAAA